MRMCIAFVGDDFVLIRDQGRIRAGRRWNGSDPSSPEPAQVEFDPLFRANVKAHPGRSDRVREMIGRLDYWQTCKARNHLRLARRLRLDDLCNRVETPKLDRESSIV